MGIFGGGSNKQVSTTQSSSQSQSTPSAWAPAQPYMEDFYRFASQAAQQPPQYYQGSTLAGLSPTTQKGWQSLGNAGSMQDWMYGQTVPAYFQALNAPDVANNPYVQQMAAAMGGALNADFQNTRAGQAADFNAAVRRLNQELTQTALPAVNAGAALQGGIGGSRQALAQAVAIRENQGQMQDFKSKQLTELANLGRTQAAQEALGLANLYNQSYETGVGARTAALGMMPQMQAGATAGADTQLRLGGLQETRQQQEIDADRARFEYYRDYPANMAKLFGSLFTNANVPFGDDSYSSSQSSSSSYGKMKQDPDLSQVIGSAIGAFAVMSDRRLKTNITRIGETRAGYPVYAFDYVWGEPGVGVMADEVPSEWTVHTPSGYSAVDYSKVR